MPLLVDPPPWIADLPTDARGFHVPAEAGWSEVGEPKIAMVATDRKIALAMQRACAVCGYPMTKGRPVFRAFSQFDAAQIRGYERESSQDLAGPLHKSCVLYSAMVCPYLRERTSRLGKDNKITPGAKRGTLAAVMGFEDMSVLVYAAPHHFLSEESPVPHIGYLRLCEDIRYRDGGELADLYAEAVADDAGFIDVTAKRQYWRHDDMDALGTALAENFRELNSRPIDYDMVIHPGVRYAGFNL